MQDSENSFADSDHQTLANNAVLSLAESDPTELNEFIKFIDSNEFLSVARIQGLPVYRLRDYQQRHHCYIVNELNTVPDTASSAIEYAVLGSYLIFSDQPVSRNASPEKYMVPQEIINVANTAPCANSLTTAELRLVSQLIAGMDIKSAAEVDNVSTETKRTQLKSVTSKLGVSRQQDILRLMLPALARLTDPGNWDKSEQRLFNRYVSDYMPPGVRCNRLSDREGRSVRIIDFGPVRGKPVIILHSMIFPDITPADVQLAEELGLRLIWPLRPGLFEVTPYPKSSDQYCREVIEGIELAWENLCGEPVPVIAMVSSAWHAVDFAQRFPQRVSHISFAATCFSAGRYENSLRYFGSSVAELCSRNTWLMTRTVDFIQRNVRDLKRFSATIKQVFKNSNPDMDVLNREFESTNRGERLMTALVDSPESVKHDYFNQVHFNWAEVSELQTPLHFFHGAKDTVHKVPDLQNLLAGISNPPLTVFEDAGHIMQYQHFHRLLHECSRQWEQFRPA